MRAYAEYFKEEPEYWGIAGLLHDLDYERFPDKHPYESQKILAEHGYPQDIIDAIMGHATYSGVARETKMAKTLFAVDELAGFVIAVALVRPEKFVGMASKSVTKKFKDKRFAANINRAEIAQGVSELGVNEDEHIDRVIAAIAKVITV